MNAVQPVQTIPPTASSKFNNSDDDLISCARACVISG